ncbi:type I-C CRISPR-associated protein Cas8c/Csd1 [Cypionkella sp. TWP1-2-1b2]|uniref:type I-C CRISPR-associated protein Cas8c/Csd1 n=1 Tax=Cypionkella sp. TWP1-2-1b2 TaxID=2804675 RepID=UPI003CFB8A0D
MSFDKDSDAFSSYGHLLAENAPTAISVAFAHTAVLNHFLARDSGHCIQIGDTSTVFWADGSAVEAKVSERLFFAMMSGGDAAGEDPTAEDKIATTQITLWLEMIQQGNALGQVAPKLADGVRIHILGLAPNAARLSVRFHYEDDSCKLMANYQNHLNNLMLAPPS